MNAEVRDLPLPEVEHYLTRQEFADLFGCSLTTVDNMIREGMPSVRWGKRIRRIQPSKALAWIRDRDREAA